MGKVTKVCVSLVLTVVAFVALIPALYVSRTFNVSYDTITLILIVMVTVAISFLWKRT